MRRGYARSCWGTTAHAGTLLIAAAAALAACDRTRSEPPPRQAPARIASAAADSIALDSCARLDAQARPQQRAAESAHADPPPHPGSWTATKRLTFDGFSIDVPAVVTSRPPDTEGAVITDFPGCRYFCAMSVTIRPDSAGGLDAYVTELRTPSSADSTESYIPGPPRPIAVGGGHGVVMEDECGDCTGALVVTAAPGRIATISFSIEDGEGYQPGLMCRLTRTAATFRWASAP
jgi:hypothetical protein